MPGQSDRTKTSQPDPRAPPDHRRAIYHVLTAVAACGLAACARTDARDPSELRLLTLAEAEHLDPRFPEDALGASLARLNYRGLLSSDPRTFAPRPCLASSWRFTDARHIELELLRDQRFHDGRPVVADDVVATYRSLLSPTTSSRLRGTYSRVIEAIDALGAHALRVTLRQPDGTIESLLQQPIVPAGVAAGGEIPALPGHESRFVGSGPLGVASLLRGDWRFRVIAPFSAGPRAVRVISLHDPNALTLRLLHGGGDIAEIKPEQYDILAQHPEFELASAPTAGVSYLGFQCDHGPLSDLRVRRAIARSIDRDALRLARFGRRALAATGPLPPGHWAYSGDVARYPFDPAVARRLLDAAGLMSVGGAPRFRLVMRVSSQRSALAVAQAIAAMLASVDIAVELRPSELATLLGDLRAGRFDLTYLTIPDLSDPSGLSFWFGSRSIPEVGRAGGGGNRWRYRDPRLDAVLDQGAAVSGVTARRPYYQTAQRYLAEGLPVLPLWHADVVFAVRSPWRGLRPRGDGQLEFLLDLRR